MIDSATSSARALARCFSSFLVLTVVLAAGFGVLLARRELAGMESLWLTLVAQILCFLVATVVLGAYDGRISASRAGRRKLIANLPQSISASMGAMLLYVVLAALALGAHVSALPYVLGPLSKVILFGLMGVIPASRLITGRWPTPLALMVGLALGLPLVILVALLGMGIQHASWAGAYPRALFETAFGAAAGVAFYLAERRGMQQRL